MDDRGASKISLAMAEAMSGVGRSIEETTSSMRHMGSIWPTTLSLAFRPLSFGEVHHADVWGDRWIMALGGSPHEGAHYGIDLASGELILFYPKPRT